MKDHEFSYLKFVSAFFPTTWAMNDLMVQMYPPYTLIITRGGVLSGNVAASLVKTSMTLVRVLSRYSVTGWRVLCGFVLQGCHFVFQCTVTTCDWDNDAHLMSL